MDCDPRAEQRRRQAAADLGAWPCRRAVSLAQPRIFDVQKRIKKKFFRSKNSAQSILAQDRRIQVLRYRIMGYTYEQIGDAMGFTRQRAWELVEQELRACGRERCKKADQLRVFIIERYDRVIYRLWKLCYPVDGGIDLHALDRLIKIHQHLCRLYGIKGPQRAGLDMRDADNMVKTFANISLPFVPEQDREAYIAEVQALVDRVEREHESVGAHSRSRLRS